MVVIKSILATVKQLAYWSRERKGAEREGGRGREVREERED